MYNTTGDVALTNINWETKYFHDFQYSIQNNSYLYLS